MEHNDLIKKLKKEYENIKVNQKGIDIMKKSIDKAKKEKTNTKKWIGIGIAASLAIFIIAPNVSPTVAMAMNKIPVIAQITNIITLNKYSNPNKNVNVELPVVENENNSLQDFNKTTDDYIKNLVEKFESEFNEGDKKSLDISYNVVTDNENIFSLKINGLEIGASGYQYSKVYNLDKNTGEILELKDIFKQDSNYIEVVSENIKNQMRKQMQEDENKIYFIDKEDEPGEQFEQIK